MELLVFSFRGVVLASNALTMGFLVLLFLNLRSGDCGEYILLMFWHFKGITYQIESSVGSEIFCLLPICRDEVFLFPLFVFECSQFDQ